MKKFLCKISLHNTETCKVCKQGDKKGRPVIRTAEGIPVHPLCVAYLKKEYCGAFIETTLLGDITCANEKGCCQLHDK